MRSATWRNRRLSSHGNDLLVRKAVQIGREAGLERHLEKADGLLNFGFVCCAKGAGDEGDEQLEVHDDVRKMAVNVKLQGNNTDNTPCFNASGCLKSNAELYR